VNACPRAILLANMLQNLFSRPTRPDLGQKVLVVGASVGLATVVRMVVEWQFGPFVPYYATFYPAVACAAFFGGLWAGLAAIVLPIIVVWLVFIPPVYKFQPLAPRDIATLLSFAVSGLVLVWLANVQRKLLARLEEKEEVQTQLRRDSEQITADLYRSNSLLESIINMTPDLVFVKDLESRAILRNPAALFGKRWEDIKGRPEAEWHVDNEQARQVIENDRKVVAAGASMQFVERFSTEQGLRTLLSTKSPMFDSSGKIVGVIGVSTDITEREERARHVEFIMRELSHRSKNLLAVIQSIFRQSAKQSASLEEFEEKFSDRLGSLAKLHDLLVNEDWRGVSLRALIETQLSVFTNRVILNGPEILLRPSAGQILSMAFHELATNAIKYGALSNGEGVVNLAWAKDEESEATLNIFWREMGGPKVAAPNKQGFGTLVLERASLQILGASASLQFEKEGVTWNIRAPITSIGADAEKR
jgi:PAS domain S-box-containing protein